MRLKLLIVFLLVSVALNGYMAWRCFRSATSRLVQRRELAPPRTVTTNILRPIRTNVVVRPQMLTWRDIESDDYVTYVRNLRAIGCPEQTVRDIIVADVNELFAQRRATELFNPLHEWWRPEPDQEKVEQAAEQRHAIEMERRTLLAQLLGPDWEYSGSLLTESAAGSVALDGPLLGAMQLETKQAVRRIELNGLERERALARRAKEQNQPVDSVELARLRQQTRQELSQVLSTAQLEEYMLRYSRTSADLRDSLKGFEPSPDEYRRMFNVIDPIEQELALIGDASDAASLRLRQQLDLQREASVAEALGDDRYLFYKLNQDPLFQRARDTARQVGASAETVLTLYQIDRVTDAERQRILEDNSLTPTEQSTRLAQADQERLDSIRKLLGEAAFRRIQSSGAR